MKLAVYITNDGSRRRLSTICSTGWVASRSGWGRSWQRWERARRLSLTGEGKPAPLALDLLNATASKAGSSLDDAKAVKSQETENATELRWGLVLQAGLAEAVDGTVSQIKARGLS